MLKKLLFNILCLFGVVFSLVAQEVPVHFRFSVKKIADCEYDLQFNASIDDTWHMYSLAPAKDGPNPTAFNFIKSNDYELVGNIKESKPLQAFDKVFDMTVNYFEHAATFTQRIKLKTNKKISIKGTYEYQACTEEKCIFPPSENFEFPLEGSPNCTNAEKTLSTKEDLSKSTIAINSNSQTILPTSHISESTKQLDSVSTQHSTHEPVNVLKSHETSSPVQSSKSWWGIFIAGFIGGLAALLTPCVFPMIPMNVSFFTKQSKTKSEGVKNALLYAVSIIILYVSLGLGVTLIFGAGALHSLSTNVWFNLAFFVLLLVFAMSFLGAFEITLPSSFVNKMDAKSDKGGYVGIFFMAFTLALVSFSCTGPIIGTLLVEASSTGNVSGPFWGMFGFSLALALPFGLFAAFPGWLNSLPQSGGWLNAVKVTLGFLELALALKFASNADLVVQAGILTREVFIGLWIVIFALLSMYLIGLFKTSHDSDLKHISVGRLFVAIISFFITMYLIPGMWGAPLKLFSGILPPLEYSESPHGFGGSHISAHASNSISQDTEYSQFMEVNKNGIVHFKNDYEHALAYSKKVGKPLLIDFTGHACANCRKTEDYVWPDIEVTKRLNDEVVLVSLYVDDKRSLDPKEFMTVEWYGKTRQITDIGDKFKYMQEKLYGQSTQPLYVMVDGNEQVLAPIRGYNPSISEYIKWLDEGIKHFKKQD